MYILAFYAATNEGNSDVYTAISSASNESDLDSTLSAHSAVIDIEADVRQSFVQRFYSGWIDSLNLGWSSSDMMIIYDAVFQVNILNLNVLHFGYIPPKCQNSRL